jgi:hypothetical protein
MVEASKFEFPTSFKGRHLGVLILVIMQFLVGAIHVVIGLGLILSVFGESVYGAYTFLYGVFTLFFAYNLWEGRRFGWMGTILVSSFVIVVDVSAILNVSLIAGVPVGAAFGEIFYSLAVLLCLFQHKIIRMF